MMVNCLKMVIIMKKNNNDSIILFVIVVLILLAVLYVPNFIKNFGKNESIINYNVELKENYQPNEIIPIYVDDEQMSKIYFKDFLYKVISDIDSSYLFLNEDYREDSFKDIYKYKDYINSLNLSIDDSVSKFATYERGIYKYYDVYDNIGNRFIFRTNGVMQYEVYFDLDEGEED